MTAEECWEKLHVWVVRNISGLHLRAEELIQEYGQQEYRRGVEDMRRGVKGYSSSQIMHGKPAILPENIDYVADGLLGIWRFKEKE